MSDSQFYVLVDRIEKEIIDQETMAKTAGVPGIHQWIAENLRAILTDCGVPARG